MGIHYQVRKKELALASLLAAASSLPIFATMKGARTSKSDQVSILEEKLVRNHAVVCVFAALGIGMMVAENYILWSHGGEPDGACEVLKLGSTFTTAFLVVFLYVWHKRKFEHAQAWQHGLRVPLVSPELGSCGPSGRAWRLWAARHTQDRGQATGHPATASGARASRITLQSTFAAFH